MIFTQRMQILLPCLTLAVATSIADVRIDLHRGDPLPAITLTTIDDHRISISEPSSGVRIYLLGQSNHDQTLIACELIAGALKNHLLDDVDIQWVYILSKNSDLGKAQLCGQPEHKPMVVHDTDRKIFGAFDVITMPTVVIADAQARVVHVIPSMTPRFEDIVADAILLAAQKIELAEFENTLHPNQTQPNGDRVRAKRIMKLARQASKREMYEMASAQFVYAIEVDPTYPQPRLALGYLLRRQMKLDEAQQAFEALLEQDSENTDGKLGLATVLIARKGEHLDEVDAIIRGVLKNEPENARAHYIQGMLFQEVGRLEQASKSYQMAARILLATADPDQRIGGEN